MKFPQRISSMSRSRGTRELRKGVGTLIGSKSHISSRRGTKLYIPLIKFIHEHDPEKYSQIAEWLDAREPLDEILSLETEPAAWRLRITSAPPTKAMMVEMTSATRRC